MAKPTTFQDTSVQDPFFESQEDQSLVQYAQQSAVTKEPPKKKKKKRFGWAFFLASMFTGLAFTATFGNPFGLMFGMGVGFLFFVDPIHDRTMRLFEGKKGQADQKYLP